MQFQSLGPEDPLEKEMATHSSILAWKIPWTEEAGGGQSMGLQRVRHNIVTKPASYVGGTLITLWRVKEVSHKGPQTIRSRLFEMPRKGKLVETEGKWFSGRLGPRGVGMGSECLVVLFDTDLQLVTST